MENVFYIYVSVMIAISLVIYIRMRDTRDHSLILED
jgi:MHS family alpha-ketoglutarate permease-like MFS transporter